MSFNRYDQYALTLTDANGNQFLSGLPFVDYLYSGRVTYHQVKQNEVAALDLIAYIYFNDFSYWPLIAWYNNIFDEFCDVTEGTVLAIPIDGPQQISAVIPFTYQQA